MSDPARYRKSHMKRQVPYLLILKRYWRRILTTGGLWFIYDFISYPSSVFSSTILDVVVPVGSPLIQTAGWNTLLYTFYLPGAIAGALLADKIGRRKTMASGFIAQGIIGMIMGGCLNLLVENCFPMFVIMYGLFLMMGELGPGDTIGLVSTEIYPTAVRGTAYGISAGKYRG
jgi:MFS family permease